MSITQNRKFSIIKYVYLFLLSVLFLTIYSITTSPITSFSGNDSAFFQLVGQGMTDGLQPYRDFFDMKGPYLFFIQWLGQLIWRGRMGIFMIQILNLFLSLVITDKIFAIPFTSVRRWLIPETLSVLPVLFFASFTLEYGNLTEEFSLPCLLLSLLLVKKYFQTPEENHPVKYAFIYGLSCGFLAFIRINNAAFIGAVVLTVIINLIRHRRFVNLLLNAVGYLLGVAVAALPVVIYFSAHGILSDMFYQVFQFGFIYSQTGSVAQKLLGVVTRYWNCLLVLLFPVFVAALNYRKNRTSKQNLLYLILSVNGFLFMLLAVCLGNAYLHYFFLGIPNLVLGILLCRDVMFKNMPFRKRVSVRNLATVLLLLLVVLNINHFFTRSAICASNILQLRSDTGFVTDANDIVEQVPAEDRDSIFVYAMPSCSMWYYSTNLYPPHRYCDWHSNYTRLSPEIKEELTEWIAQGGPAYIVTGENAEITPESIGQAVSDNYTLVYTNGHFSLYQLSSTAQS